MKLKEVTIHKFKSFYDEQSFKIEDDITILVGVNESGKTAVLEAIAKSNYFKKDDKDFKFNLTHDYPRKEKKKIERKIKNEEDFQPLAITLTYEIDADLLNDIKEDLGDGIFLNREIKVSIDYANKKIFEDIKIDLKKFWENKLTEIGIKDEIKKEFYNVSTIEDLTTTIKKLTNNNEDDNVKITNADIENIKKLERFLINEWEWDNAIEEFVAREYIDKNLPKFMFYSEYYMLPSRIPIELIKEYIDKGETDIEDTNFSIEELKTAAALIELADFDLSKVIENNEFEDLKAELEATQSEITQELKKYWSTNKNLKIRFDVDKREKNERYNNGIFEHILDIRVENTDADVSLPLRSRSKGFNWFFSFMIWFKKIQEDRNSKHILLLDEPGLNLHAAAQEDLLRFIEDLSDEYQIIYTTHSPFMVPVDKLHRVRVLEEKEGKSIISEDIQKKDPRSLFPLQAALGYNLAQNLFISPNNLLVEGVSDMVYLEIMSGILEEAGREGLKKDITIVPTGGLDKVVTFISLLRGNKLNIVCLLDTPSSGSDQKLKNAIKNKLIKERNIRYFHEYVTVKPANIEDLFHKEDYLKLFNEAFKNKYKHINISELKDDNETIVTQIIKKLQQTRFNHFLPAKILSKKGYTAADFEEETLNNFEKVFKEINKLFE